MTTLRPERPADGPMSYEDTGQFEVVVGQLADPLNDPLPSRPPVVPDHPEEPLPAADAAPVAPPTTAAPGPLNAPTPPVPPSPVPPTPPVAPKPAAHAAPAASPSGSTPPAATAAPAAPRSTARHAAPAPAVAPEGPAEPASPWFRAPAERDPRAPRDPRGPQRPASHAIRPPDAGPVPPAPPAAPGPVRPPEPVPAPAPVRPPEPVAVPEPVAGAGAGAAGGGDDEIAATAQLPVVDAALLAGAEPAPRHLAGSEPGVDPEATLGAEPAFGPVPGPDATAPLLAPPADGGRAARRKAAARGGHRAKGRGPAAGAAGAAGVAGAPGTAASESAPPAPPMSRIEARKAAKAAKDSPAVVISRIVGELFITTGVLMLLFVTYQLWWTNVRAHQQAASASNNLEHQWAKGTAQGPDRNPGTFSPGEGFAIMYIPKLDVKAPIAQGVDKHKVLDKGMVGHYDGSLNTAMPWDKTGNFAVAAHRNTHGEPFRYINHLVPGDKVVVETANAYYTYQVTSSLASTPPSNIGVLKPVPVGSGFTAPGRYITLTTCTPEFTSTNRLIVWGKLVEERPRSAGKPDALLQG